MPIALSLSRLFLSSYLHFILIEAKPPLLFFSLIVRQAIVSPKCSLSLSRLFPLCPSLFLSLDSFFPLIFILSLLKLTHPQQLKGNSL
eukprot:c32419_g1_i1 orf=6-269(-)